MRCPICKQPAAVAKIRYSELGLNNELQPLDAAELTCGCVVRHCQLPPEDEPGAEWEPAARRRRDENLRSIFA